MAFKDDFHEIAVKIGESAEKMGFKNLEKEKSGVFGFGGDGVLVELPCDSEKIRKFCDIFRNWNFHDTLSGMIAEEQFDIAFHLGGNGAAPADRRIVELEYIRHVGLLLNHKTEYLRETGRKAVERFSEGDWRDYLSRLNSRKIRFGFYQRPGHDGKINISFDIVYHRGNAGSHFGPPAMSEEEARAWLGEKIRIPGPEGQLSLFGSANQAKKQGPRPR